MEDKPKKYYLDANALYELINKIDIFIDKVEVATSLLAIREIVDGTNEKNQLDRHEEEVEKEFLKIYRNH